jgi:hypothetical protein
MTKQWNSETIEALLAAQGIRLAPGRAEKIANALNAATVSDPLPLEFESDPTGYALALERCRAK